MLDHQTPICLGSVLMRSIKPNDFSSIPSATGRIARLAFARMREAGKDIRAVLSGAGLTLKQLDDPTVRLEVRTQIKVLELAAEVLEDDFLGFHLARSFDLREVGLFYYVTASSEHLGDALRNAERYSGINNEGVGVRFRLDGAMVITLDYRNVDRRSDRHQMEFWLTAIVRLCRQLTDSRIAPRELKVRHFRDSAPAEYKAFFASDLEFGSDADEVVFSEDVASLPLVRADTHLHELLRQYADEARVDRPHHRGSVRVNVERVIPPLLPQGKATTSVARQLGVSRRTLSRSLLVEGITFVKILEELRASLARRYLKDPALSISEIAWLLGYQEMSSFTHAFKRWTGLNPTKFRSAQAPSR
jgi:AraC-like DNA-binding protein